MKYTMMFGKTLRAAPHEYRARSQVLLVQGGFVQPLGQGLFSFLPLGIRVLNKIKRIIRSEMDSLGGQEVQVPVVNPLDIWVKTGRSLSIGKDMIRFEDRTGKKLVLSPTHEEAMVELSRRSLKSYRDLPVFLYQFQTKFRDEEKVKCGLVRAKEFLMNDAYSFHRSFSDLNNFFPKVFAAYSKIFKRCQIEFFSAESGVGYMGGKRAYEFLIPVEQGDDIVLSCKSCGYKANKDVAVGIKDYTMGNPLPIEEVETPACTTMESLSEFLNVPKNNLAKTMIYRIRGGFAMVVVRGDYEVNLDKLSTLLENPVIRLAHVEELLSLGLLPGYLSPINIDPEMPVVVDDTIANTPNLVYGGNREGIHYINVNFGRDFETEYVSDIVNIRGEDKCIQCGGKMSEIKAMELGNIFKLGDRYPRDMDLTFRDDNDNTVYPHMGSYGIGIGRMITAVVEANHDEHGIIWPYVLAPYSIYLIGIGTSGKVLRWVEKIYSLMPDEILYDDRKESPGVKFRDADLIGIPLRIVVSSKLLSEEKVEFHERESGKTWFVPLKEINEDLLSLLREK